MEVLIVLIALAAVGFAVYWMLNIKEGQNIFDLNRDGAVNKADAEVVVEKAKKNVKKAVGKATTKTKAPAKPKTAAKPKSKTK